MIVELNENNIAEESKVGLKLVDCYTTWCTYCKMQQPILEELDKDGYWIGKIDCDKNPSISEKFGIQGFPSMILFKNGQPVDILVGLHNKSQILEKLAKHI